LEGGVFVTTRVVRRGGVEEGSILELEAEPIVVHVRVLAIRQDVGVRVALAEDKQIL